MTIAVEETEFGAKISQQGHMTEWSFEVYFDGQLNYLIDELVKIRDKKQMKLRQLNNVAR